MLLNKEQTYVIDKSKYLIDLEKTFECGQCFRWNKQGDSFVGVVGNNVVELKDEGDKIIATGIGEQDFETFIPMYLDLETNYKELNDKLRSLNDDVLNTAINHGEGIRFLKQEKFETIISFIISANNRIPRIEFLVNEIAKRYGTKVTYKQKDYFFFPTPEQLRNVTKQDFRDIGVGFRDTYLYSFVQMVLNGEFDLQDNSKQIRQSLLSIPGVGPKVCSCIELFAYSNMDTFPVDTWIKKAMKDMYKDELKKEGFEYENISNKDIEKFAQKRYGALKGLAQQYIFYYYRGKS